jgi:hypothetical protein
MLLRSLLSLAWNAMPPMESLANGKSIKNCVLYPIHKMEKEMEVVVDTLFPSSHFKKSDYSREERLRAEESAHRALERASRYIHRR